MKRKSIIPWILAIAAPILTLLTVAFIQIFVRRVVLSGNEVNEGGVLLALNLISLTFGVLGLTLFLGLPLWIYALMRTMKHNEKIKSEPKFNKK